MELTYLATMNCWVKCVYLLVASLENIGRTKVAPALKSGFCCLVTSASKLQILTREKPRASLLVPMAKKELPVKIEASCKDC